MVKRDNTRQHSFTERDQELLEVHGFDLLAHIEAMLRHARQYQREVQRLRGTMGKGQTATADLSPIKAVDVHLNRLRETCTAFTETLDEILEIHEARASSPATASDRRKRR
jgi:hypothetical protein